MFDTNGYDSLLEDTTTCKKLLDLISKGEIELLTTHIQRDEFLAMKDEAKKAKLLGLLGRAQMVGTRGVILGLSRLGQSKFGSDEDHRLIEQIRSNRPDRDTEDSLIAATSSTDVDILVTDDKDFIQKLKNANLKCDVLNFDEFKHRFAAFPS